MTFAIIVVLKIIQILVEHIAEYIYFYNDQLESGKNAYASPPRHFSSPRISAFNLSIIHLLIPTLILTHIYTFSNGREQKLISTEPLKETFCCRDSNEALHGCLRGMTKYRYRTRMLW